MSKNGIQILDMLQNTEQNQIQIIEENEKRDCIINHFLPSMTLFSVMHEDLKKNAMIGDNICNNKTKIRKRYTSS